MSLCCVILYVCLSKDLIAIIFAQKPRRIQVDLAPDDIAEFYLQPGKANKPYPGARLELYQKIDITVRAKVFPKYRTKKG
jgi:hypothetical protein